MHERLRSSISLGDLSNEHRHTQALEVMSRGKLAAPDSLLSLLNMQAHAAAAELDCVRVSRTLVYKAGDCSYYRWRLLVRDGGAPVSLEALCQSRGLAGFAFTLPAAVCTRLGAAAASTNQPGFLLGSSADDEEHAKGEANLSRRWLMQQPLRLDNKKTSGKKRKRDKQAVSSVAEEKKVAEGKKVAPRSHKKAITEAVVAGPPPKAFAAKTLPSKTRSSSSFSRRSKRTVN